MYSPRIVEANVAAYERSSKHKLARLTVDQSRLYCERLDRLLAAAKGDPAEARKQMRSEDHSFIRNERVLSTLDFSYWAARYSTIQANSGGVTHFTNPWGSQQLVLDRFARLEEERADAAAHGDTPEGLLVVVHKARQIGMTALARQMLTHRLTTQEHRRAMGASIDEDKVQELYDRDKLIVDNLPWWLRPSIGYDEKRTHVYFDLLDSRILYQVSSQKTGLGVGRQFNYGHLTELSTWELVSANVDKLVELDFIPTLPSALSTLCIFESVAFGRGNWWHRFSERVRHGKSVRFRYVFIPWYAEPDKYRLTPPEGWIPNDTSLLHAERCHDTSPEFLAKHVMLSREQLYWWEVNREEHRKSNNLIYFLTNWPATPEESFQFTQKSVWPVELIEEMRAHATVGRAYELAAYAAGGSL